MFLFPWLDWGNDISDFEKIDFLAGQAILSVFSPLQKWFFTLGTFSQLGLESPRRKILKFFFGNFQKTSKLSKNIFWASSDHVVAQKSIFWKKIFEKVTISCNPPPFSYRRDIIISRSMISNTAKTKRFLGQTNFVLMFLFPWLDCGIDITHVAKQGGIAFATFSDFIF